MPYVYSETSQCGRMIEKLSKAMSSALVGNSCYQLSGKQSAESQFQMYRKYILGISNTVKLHVSAMVSYVTSASTVRCCQQHCRKHIWLGRSVMTKSSFREKAMLGKTRQLVTDQSDGQCIKTETINNKESSRTEKK